MVIIERARVFRNQRRKWNLETKAEERAGIGTKQNEKPVLDPRTITFGNNLFD